MKMTKATARKVRTALDWSMTTTVVLLGGSLFTLFVLTVLNVILGAWSMGLGFVPVVVIVVILFALVWAYLDKQVHDTLGEEDEDDQTSTTL